MQRLSAHPMSPRPFSLPTLLMAALLAALVCILHFFPGELVDRQILRGALYFLIAGCAIQLADAWLISPLVHRTRLPRLVHTIIKFLVGFTVVFTLLRMLYDIDLMPLLTTSAVLSFVLGLALQDTLGNFFAGVTINIEQPYRVGDWINASGTDGRVVEVTWRATKLLTNDNNFLIVPNSSISKDTIVNYSAPEPVSALWVDVDLEYDIPPNKAKAVILEALRCIPGLSTPRQPNVMVKGFAESSITYGVRIWIDDWSRKNQIASDVRTHLWYALRRADMSIPFPVRNMVIQRPPPPPRSVAEEAMDILPHTHFFATQPASVIKDISTAIRKLEFGAGSFLFKEGDPGESLLILTSGRLAVLKGQLKVAELEVGSPFGEMSLLTGAPRSASIQALEDCVCLELTKDTFARIAAQHHSLLDELGDIITKRQLSTQEALEKARHEMNTGEADTHTAFKNKLLGVMKGFLGLGHGKRNS